MNAPLFNLAVLLTAFAATAVYADEPEAKKEYIPGWGLASDPAADCKVEAIGSKLRITVPGSVKAHDLSPEMHNVTAPTVVRSVRGDFVVQVRVDGEFTPSDESTAAGRTGYTGAGLVVVADEKNFVRIERATLHTGEEPVPYTNFEIRVNGELQRFGTTGDFTTEKEKPTWLRLERKGDQILGAMSQDGENWTYGEAKTLTADIWKSGAITAGVAAISTSKDKFIPEYSEFQIKQGAPEPADENAVEKAK